MPSGFDDTEGFSFSGRNQMVASELCPRAQQCEGLLELLADGCAVSAHRPFTETTLLQVVTDLDYRW
jgi:hypothetical protein